MAPKYKPGGKRFPPKTSSKVFPPQAPSLSSTSNSPSQSGLDQEAENKFELELCWCIQQLELGINCGKLGEKQMKDTQKNLELLKSNNSTLIRKRQIMRTTFGDYRAKMIQEEKKHGKTASTIKFSNSKTNNYKSTFIKKAHKLTNQDSSTNKCDDEVGKNETSIPQLSSLFNKNTSTEPFKFSFSQAHE